MAWGTEGPFFDFRLPRLPAGATLAGDRNCLRRKSSLFTAYDTNGGSGRPIEMPTAAWAGDQVVRQNIEIVAPGNFRQLLRRDAR
jgi:hypothetical protein